MARLIVFSDYLSSGDIEHTLINLEYISTREGVELNDEQSHELNEIKILNQVTEKYPNTKKQRSIIKEIITKYPDIKELEEFEQYEANPNMYTASKFIATSLEYLEEMSLSNNIYMNYISSRPGVQKNEDSQHGLFDQYGSANLEQYHTELSTYYGNVYRDIISLRLNDAIELDYCDADSWKLLLQNEMHKKARLLGIPEEDFKWCAAFHNAGSHPHVHVMSWDSRGNRGWQDEDAIKKFKSNLTNEIFKNEMWLYKELNTEYRNDLEDTFKDKIQNWSKDVFDAIQDDFIKDIRNDLLKLSHQINATGSKYYAYQNEQAKETIKSIVSKILNSKEMKPLFEEYIKTHVDLSSFYLKDKLEIEANNFMKRLIDPSKKDRKVLHNFVLKTAYEIHSDEIKTSILNHQHTNGLHYKLVSNYPVPNEILENDKRKDTLVKGLLKVESLRSSNIDELMQTVHYIEPNEEKIYEILLDIKTNSTIKDSEIKLINKAYQESLASDILKQTTQKLEVNSTHATTHLIQNIVNFIASDTVHQERETMRIKAIHRQDEYIIKKNQRKERR